VCDPVTITALVVGLGKLAISAYAFDFSRWIALTLSRHRRFGDIARANAGGSAAVRLSLGRMTTDRPLGGWLGEGLGGRAP